MSFTAIGRSQRAWRNPSIVCPSAMTLDFGLRKPRRRSMRLKPSVERPARRVLQLHVEAGVNRKTVLVEPLGPVSPFQFLTHLFDEIGRD